MRFIRNWYQLLDQSGLNAYDSGPGQANGTLTANINWLQYYYPPGTQLGYKGCVIAASQSRIVSAAAAGFYDDQGSIEMLIRPSWSQADGQLHYFWDTYGGPNERFNLRKTAAGATELVTGGAYRGAVSFPWVNGTLYHVVLNWGPNTLYINGILRKTFTPSGLGNGATTLYIGDQYTGANYSFNGFIYYFIARDYILTADEIALFKSFFESQYIPPP